MAEKAGKIMTPSRQASLKPASSFIQRKGESYFFSSANSASFIQPKVQISQPGDPYEKEADTTADRVMRMTEPVGLSFSQTSPHSETAQMKCAECEKEEKLQKKEDEEIQPKLYVNAGGSLVQRSEDKEEVQAKMENNTVQRNEEKKDDLQPMLFRMPTDENKKEDDRDQIHPKLAFLARKERGPPNVSTQFTSTLHNNKGSGNPLDNGTRHFMESRFNADFSHVRIHTGSSAIQMSTQIGAQAFTHGKDIYFNSGKFNPESGTGKHLLAHELTHTIQQGASNSVSPFLSAKLYRSADHQVNNDEKESEVVQRKESAPSLVRPELKKAVAYAKSQAGKVNAQQKNSDGTRSGWERLSEYFKTAMGEDKIIPEGGVQTPGSILEKNIKYIDTVKAPPPNVVPTPGKAEWISRDIMPSWCGIFVFWSLNKGGLPMPKWSIGGDAIKLASAYPPKYIPKPGDIAYYKTNSHYAIVEKTEPENPSPEQWKDVKVITVNGNTSGENNLGGQVQVKTHPISHWAGDTGGFLNPLFGIMDKLQSNPQDISEAELQQIIGDSSAGDQVSFPESKPTDVKEYNPDKTRKDSLSATLQAETPEAKKGSESDQDKTAVQDEETKQIEKAPSDPKDDPAFQQVIDGSKKAAKNQRSHGDAASKSHEAQMASDISPEKDIDSQAKYYQVGKMDQQEKGKFSAEVFKQKMKEKINAAIPTSEDEAKKFKKENKLAKVKGEMQTNVADEKDKASKAIDVTANEKPSTDGITAKPVVPMHDENAGVKPVIPSSQDAAPKPKTDEEISMEKDADDLDAKMTKNNVTEKQLQNSNEPTFNSALKSKRESQQQARQVPAEYRTAEDPEIKKAELQAKATVSGKMTEVFGARQGMFGGVDTEKQGTKSKDEEKRKEIAAKLQSIYNDTKTDVDGILNGLDTKVTNDFDDAAKRANKVFEDNVDRRLDDYYTIWHKIKEVFAGLPPEVQKIFDEEKATFLQSMDDVIGTIATEVETKLNDAIKRVDKGKTDVDEYWNKLDPETQKIGQEAKDAITDKFNELEDKVNSKQDELVEKLSAKYKENVDKLQEIFDKIKSEKKGWLGAALDAIAGVIKTILALKDMLLNTLARVAHVVGQIIDDPVKFLGNMVDAIKLGLNNFITNIWTHFKKGFFEWLMCNMPPGIVFPDKWDLTGIFHFVMQIIGLTWANIRSRAVKKLGEPVVSALEEVFEIFQIIRKEGLPGLWHYIKEKIGDLKVMVIDAIQSFLIEKIVKAGIMWVIGLLNPAGAFIKACKLIYDVVMFFVNNGKRIMDLVNAVIDGVANIVAGDLVGAARLVEDSLARLIPITLGFLASLLGLDGISEKVQKIIHTIQSPINKAIDWVIDKAIALAKKLGIDKLVKKVKGGVDDAKKWAKDKVEKGKEKVIGAISNFKTLAGLKETYTAEDGKSHSIYFDSEEENGELIIASNPMSYKQFFQQYDDSKLNSKEKNAKTKGLNLAESISTLKAQRYPDNLSEIDLINRKKEKREKIRKLLAQLWPQTSVLLSGQDAPTGLTEDDAIPIQWFKPMDLYHPVILSVFPKGEDKFDWHVRSEIINNPYSHGFKLGINPAFFPSEGKKFQQLSDSRGTKTELFRLVLESAGFDWTGLDADHVQDLQYSGKDIISNMWPLDSSANSSAGSRQVQQIVKWKDGDKKVIAISLGDQRLKGKWLKIKKIGL